MDEEQEVTYPLMTDICPECGGRVAIDEVPHDDGTTTILKTPAGEKPNEWQLVAINPEGFELPGGLPVQKLLELDNAVVFRVHDLARHQENAEIIVRQLKSMCPGKQVLCLDSAMEIDFFRAVPIFHAPVFQQTSMDVFSVDHGEHGKTHEVRRGGMRIGSVVEVAETDDPRMVELKLELDIPEDGEVYKSLLGRLDIHCWNPVISSIKRMMTRKKDKMRTVKITCEIDRKALPDLDASFWGVDLSDNAGEPRAQFGRVEEPIDG